MLAGDLVPGDTVYISLGDRVPADIRLTEVSVRIITSNQQVFFTRGRMIEWANRKVSQGSPPPSV